MAGMKLVLLVAFVAMAATCVAARSRDSDVETIKFREYYSKGEESTVFGPEPTENSDKNFGKGRVYDFKVEIDDREVGRSRGLYIHDSIDGDGGQELFTVSFESGDLKGNSITFGGHWSDDNDRNELSVTGGTGIFKFATGSALYKDKDGSYYEVRVSLKDVQKLPPTFAGL